MLPSSLMSFSLFSYIFICSCMTSGASPESNLTLLSFTIAMLSTRCLSCPSGVQLSTLGVWSLACLGYLNIGRSIQLSTMQPLVKKLTMDLRRVNLTAALSITQSHPKIVIQIDMMASMQNSVKEISGWSRFCFATWMMISWNLSPFEKPCGTGMVPKFTW